MSASAAQPIAAAPVQYVTYSGSQAGGVPMEPVAQNPMPVYQGAPQTMSYQTVGAASISGLPAQGQVTYGAPQIIQAPAQYVQAPPQVSYMQQPAQEVTYMTAPQETTQQAVTYMQAAPQEATAGTITYSAAPMAVPTVLQAAAPQVTYSTQQVGAAYTTQQVGAAYTTGLQSVNSMVAYPGAVTSASYFPMSVQQAFSNHFDAFGTRNLEKTMLDYDETSIVRVYATDSNQLSEYRGLMQIREFFNGTFAQLPDMTTLEAPVKTIDDEYKQVFLVWKCPGCNVKLASDTFIFGPDFKIKRQNVTLDKGAMGMAAQASHAVHNTGAAMGAAAAGAAGAVGGAAVGAAGAVAAAAPTSTISSAKASKKKDSKKKDSKKKLGSKKKAKSGFC